MQAVDHLFTELRQLLIRTQTILIGSIILAPIIFVIEFGPQIIRILQTGSGLHDNYAGEVTSQYIVRLLREASAYSFSKNIAVFVIWALAGVLAYVLSIAALRWMTAVRNEIVIDTSYSKGSAAKLIALHFTQKIAVFLIFCIFAAACFLLFIPYSMDLMRIFMYDLRWFNAPLLLLGLLGLTCTMYVLASFAYLAWLYEEEV